MIKPFAYVKPKTIDHALEALQEDNSRPLAGGTDLLVDMRNALEEPSLLVDIKGLDELNVFSIDPENGITIGASTTLNAIVEDRRLQDSCSVVSDAAFTIATYQVRNRATLVGNICNASPGADMAPPLYILSARLVMMGPKGERKLPIAEFLTGVKKTALKKGELVVRVEIPPTPKARMVFMKKQRIRGHDLALINVAGLADARLGKLRICLGACAERPVLLKGTDELFRETGSVEKLAERVADLALSSIDPIDDVRASSAYRTDMVSVFVRKVIREICS